MPNHILNVIKVEEPEDEIKGQTFEALKKFVKCKDKDQKDYLFDFENIIPMPKSVFRGNLGREEEIKYPGEKNWYGWGIAHWGTKWNAYSAWADNYEYIGFQTAWNHPEPVITALSKKFPNLKLTVSFADEDRGYNLGIYKIQNGEVLEQLQIEFGTPEAELLADTIWAADRS